MDSGSTSSESTLRLCKAWLQSCLQSHTECSLQLMDQRFPARVIQVGSDGDTLVRLYAPKDLADAQPYCTLSHRWGNANIVTLSKETHEDFFKKGIAVGSLPQTFQDAIRVTRYLGAKHLWIDSLCIFQDNADDWRSQGLIMDAIYANGLSNIAANAGQNSHAGLFRRRDPNRLRPVVIEIPWQSRGFDAPVLKYFIWHSDYWDLEVNNATLYTRGWVAQERLLSMRILHFGESQAHWECMCLQASESFPRSYPFDSYSTSRLNKKLARAFHAERSGMSEYNVYMAWESFVTAYSRCELTKDEDVLVAVQGIKHSIQLALQSSTQGNYFAGLWHKRFLQSATWHSGAYQGERAERPRPLRAPTWTWASVKGPINFFGASTSSFRRTSFFEVAAKDVNLDAGCITLRDVHLQECEWAVIPVTTSKPGIRFVVTFSFGGQLLSADARLDESQLIQKCLDANKPTKKISIHILVTLIDEKYMSWDVEGLLLQQVDRSRTTVFERIGSFRIEEGTLDGKSIVNIWSNEQVKPQTFGSARTIQLI